MLLFELFSNPRSSSFGEMNEILPEFTIRLGYFPIWLLIVQGPALNLSQIFVNSNTDGRIIDWILSNSFPFPGNSIDNN